MTALLFSMCTCCEVATVTLNDPNYSQKNYLFLAPAKVASTVSFSWLSVVKTPVHHSQLLSAGISFDMHSGFCCIQGTVGNAKEIEETSSSSFHSRTSQLNSAGAIHVTNKIQTRTTQAFIFEAVLSCEIRKLSGMQRAF